jgi:hypothetical protein
MAVMSARMLRQSVDVSAVSIVMVLGIGIGTLAFSTGYSVLTSLAVGGLTAVIGGWSLN